MAPTAGPQRTTTTELPVIVYAARSQADEAGKDSTGDQVAIILRRLGNEPGRVVRGAPHTDHASGYRGNRGPGLDAAIRDAEQAAREHGRAELWVWITSRLGRGTGGPGEARAIGHLLYELHAKGVTVRSVEDDEFATNEMLWGFASRMASKYSEDLAANVKRGIASQVDKGKPWGEPGFGYVKGDDGHWIIEPGEAAAARRAFSEYVERTPSFSGVARVLNAAGIRPRRSTRWAPGVVRRLLTSRHVLGEFHHAGAWHQGSHEAIIDAGTWQAAQALAEQGAKYAPRGRSGRLPKAHVFVRGMLRCGACGEAMLPRSDEGRDTYVCRSRKTWGTCSMPILRREVVEAAALALFEERALDYEATKAHIAAQLDTRAGEARSQAARATTEGSHVRQALARFDRDYAAGVLSGENYQRLTAQFGDELAGAEAEAERLRAHAVEIGDQLEHLDAESETLRRLAELRAAVSARISGASRDLGALRAALAAVFESVEILPGTDDEPDLYVVPRVRGELPNGWISLEAVRSPLAFDVVVDKCSSSGLLEHLFGSALIEVFPS